METVSSKVPAHLKEEIDDYAETIEESRSIAIRDLLEEGVAARRPSYALHHVAAWFGALMLGSLFSPASPSMAVYVALLGLLLFAGGVLWPYLAPRLFGRESR